MTDGIRGPHAGPAAGRSAWLAILIGVGAVIVILACATYAAAEWLRYRVEGAIAASFASMRTKAGDPATYGRAQFDPWTRTVRMSEVAFPANPNATSLTKVGELVMTGVPLFPSGHITARRAELTNMELPAPTGAFNVTRIDEVTIDDLDVSRPADWQRLRTVAQAASGPQQSAPQAKDLLPAGAQALEGTRFARLEMHGIRFSDAAKGFEIGSARLDRLADGRLAEVTLRDVSSVSPQGKVTCGRVTLKQIDVAGLLRKSAQLSGTNRPPTPEEIGALASILQGVEMDDVVVPDARPGRPPGTMIHLLSLQLSWGQFVGTLPTTAHYVAKAEMPIGNETGDAFNALRAAGFNSLMLGFDVGSTWTEQTRTFALSPGAFQVDNLFSASLALSIGNFSPDLLINDPAKMAPAVAALEAGPIELSFRDSGLLDLVTAQVAKSQGISVSAARSKAIDDMNQAVRAQPQQSPELNRLVDALARFLGASGQTLKVRLTPKGQVNIMQTLQSTKTNPVAALARFNVEASVGAP
jgi:hypothetical protein